jgi:hypothetical protein
MMPRSTGLVAVASLTAILLGSEAARAQAISATNQVYPTRLVNGAATGTRPINLNPYGVNYQDCINDMTLRFNLLASSLNGGQLIEVWAGTSDCTTDMSRGFQALPSCWLVRPPIAGIIAGTGSSVPLSIDVRVQDLVGHQSSIPQTPTYSAVVGAAACQTQTVDTAQSFTIFFMPTDSSGHAIANSGLYKYAITTDLVGPPAPSGVQIGGGDTLFVVNWTQNIDADTAGYDVYLAEVPGPNGASPTGVGAEQVLVCPDASTSPGSSDATVEATVEAAAEATVEAGDDGATSDAVADGAIADTAAAGGPVCTYQSMGGSGDGSGGMCGNTVLSQSSSTILDAAAAAQVDDAGNVIEGGTTSGMVGISSIPSQYLVGAGPSGVTISGRGTGTSTVTGLQNGVPYAVVVAAVDGSGNVGPPSSEQCGTPAPVNDFWNLYRADGGHAGGGFCALDAVGKPAPAVASAALVAGASLLVRRRRRARR